MQKTQKPSAINNLIISKHLFKIAKQKPSHARKMPSSIIQTSPELENEYDESYFDQLPLLLSPDTSQNWITFTRKPEINSNFKASSHHKRLVDLLINIDRSFFDEEEEVPIKEYPNEKSILPLLEDSFKRKKTMKEKTFLKKIKEEERKDSKQDSGVYNKWYMPANQRFIIKRRGKILDSKRSSLMNNESYFYNNLHIPKSESVELPSIYQNSNETKEENKRLQELQKQVTTSMALAKYKKYLINKNMRVPSSIVNHKIIL